MKIFKIYKIIDDIKKAIDVIPEKEPTVPKEDCSYANRDDHRSCGTCNMFMKEEEKCTIVKGKIIADGVCYFQSERDTKPLADAKPLDMYNQLEAGYIIIKGGTHCGICKSYVDPRKCKMVEGDIDPEKGCCALWNQ